LVNMVTTSYLLRVLTRLGEKLVDGSGSPG
jgi:hypothetical protein